MEHSSFYEAILDAVSFEGAVLDHVNLIRADVVGEDFSGVDLRGPLAFFDTDLRDVDFSGLDLNTSDLRMADLTGADLSGTVLDRVEADGTTIWPEGFDPWAAGALD